MRYIRLYVYWMHIFAKVYLLEFYEIQGNPLFLEKIYFMNILALASAK